MLSVPEIMMFHMNRASWNKQLKQYEKINTKFTFPAEVDLSIIMKDSERIWYDLIAVIQHLGEGSGNGHYIAHIASLEGWHTYNDASIQPISLCDVQEKEATTLFYRKASEPVLHILLSDIIIESTHRHLH